jgi:hypothetical protein
MLPYRLGLPNCSCPLLVFALAATRDMLCPPLSQRNHELKRL